MDLTEKTVKTLADFAEFRRQHAVVQKEARALISEKIQKICQELRDVETLAKCACVRVDMLSVGETVEEVRRVADVWFDGE